MLDCGGQWGESRRPTPHKGQPFSLSLSLSLYDTQLVYIEHVGKDATNDGFFFSFFSLHPAQLKQLNSWVCAVLDETTSHVYQSLRTI